MNLSAAILHNMAKRLDKKHGSIKIKTVHDETLLFKIEHLANCIEIKDDNPNHDSDKIRVTYFLTAPIQIYAHVEPITKEDSAIRDSY